ncbi:TetR/AcrR family transcriptional regulator [Halostreptopolyspora alba]|uniref:TetR/AcrR family transcriptional regulator n=1 Tax=Halostreptopolyspora alba TaxID=2487137 RepID=A0A3N0E325_9ACTN|nr:TetR/AcrR family transcriptional regulator [Nocardiopsaceae bacterium YIM 96095]
MDNTSLRVYGGVEGDDRRAERRTQLIEAGLDLLGSESDDVSLTVRGVCKQAGLTTRYFYESFTDRDALAIAVYDHVTDEIATTTLEAVAAAPADERAKIHAGLKNIVDIVADDPRRGRLLFSATLTNSLLLHRRVRSARLFASLLGEEARAFYGMSGSAALEPTSQFIVGGLAQTLTAWLDGTVELERHQIVDRCTEIFLAIADIRRSSREREA